MTNFHLIRCRNNTVFFSSPSGELKIPVPPGPLILSARDCHVRSFKTPYQSREDIMNYLKREIRKVHPGPYEDISIDFFKLGKRMVLGVFINKEQLAGIRKLIGSKRRICLPFPAGPFLSFAHNDGVYEIYGDIANTPGTVSFGPLSRTEISSFSLKKVFSRSSCILQQKTVLPLFIVAFILVITLPWIHIGKSRKVLKELERENQTQISVMEKALQRNKTYQVQEEQLLKIYHAMPQDFSHFLDDFSRENLPAFGIDSISWNNGIFRMHVWTDNPSLFIKVLSGNPKISNLVSDGTKEKGSSGISLSGSFNE